MKKEFLNKKIVACIALMLFFSTTILHAQSKDTEKELLNQIGLAVGLNQGFVKDLNFSALNYRQTGVLFSADYVRNKPSKKSIFTIDADVSLGKLKTQASDYFTSNLIVANVEVSYLKKMATSESKNWQVFLGGQYNSFLQILDWNDYESFSFLATHGIGVKGFANYKLNTENSVQTSLFIPVFQQLVRPPYNGIDENVIENQDNTLKLIVSGKPATFNSYFAFDYKLNYTYVFNRKINGKVTYLFRYQNVNEVNRFVQIQNQITLGLSLKF